ncbi:hypothetical protein [Streptomyces sp. NPDC056405]|uniref:hypothetical protein n=1 Tax=Streptomyces sp. NPDC056405 TaxID=3345811 RepID=UPI0035D67452
MGDIDRAGFVSWLTSHGIEGDRARWLLDRYAHHLAGRQRAEAERLCDLAEPLDDEMALILRVALDKLIEQIDPGNPDEPRSPAA